MGDCTAPVVVMCLVSDGHLVIASINRENIYEQVNIHVYVYIAMQYIYVAAEFVRVISDLKVCHCVSS